MERPKAPNCTETLLRAARGEVGAADEFLPLVYDELRNLAGSHLRSQRPGHTLQATALVHEAYLRLVESDRVDWKGRSHFFATAARAMRQILIDHARARHAAKRGGSRLRVTLSGLSGGVAAQDAGDVDLEAMAEALEKLAKLNPRHHEIVTLRFLGGLTVKEVADVLGVSQRTVEGDWRMARAWLADQLA